MPEPSEEEKRELVENFLQVSNSNLPDEQGYLNKKKRFLSLAARKRKEKSLTTTTLVIFLN